MRLQPGHVLRASRPERGRELATGSAEGITAARPGRSRPGLNDVTKRPHRVRRKRWT